MDVLCRAARNLGNIALGVAALRVAAIDIFCCATCDVGNIARYLACASGVSAVDLACSRDGAAFDGCCIADDIAICSVFGHAAVDVRMCRTAFEGRRIALDESRPACSRHAADHIVVEMVAVEYGMIVLDASAAVCSTAKDSVGGRKKRCCCRIDNDSVARHIACAESKTAVQLLSVAYIFECQRIACHVAAVSFLLDKTCGCTKSRTASGRYGVVAWCMCIVNLHILPADIGSARR